MPPLPNPQVARSIDWSPEQQNPQSENRLVVLKFMKDWLNFLKEINQRKENGLKSDHVIPVIGSSLDFDQERWAAEMKDKLPRKYIDYPYCLIMPAAGAV